MASNPSNSPIYKFELVAAEEVSTRTELQILDTSGENPRAVSQSTFRKGRVYETDSYATLLAISDDSRFKIITDEAPATKKPSATAESAKDETSAAPAAGTGAQKGDK